MSEVWLRRSVGGLEAQDDSAAKVLKRIKVGDIVKVDVTRPRNGAMHRKYWALCTLIYEAADFHSPEAVDLAIKYLTGHTDPVAIQSTGEVLQVPRSISYAKMDQTQFDDYWQKVIAAVCENILPGVTLQEFENEILRMVA